MLILILSSSYKNGLRNLDEIVKSGAYEKSDYKPTMRSNFFYLGLCIFISRFNLNFLQRL